jgi:hypothetical protein
MLAAEFCIALGVVVNHDTRRGSAYSASFVEVRMVSRLHTVLLLLYEELTFFLAQLFDAASQ